MERIKPIEALNVAGSIASITGISLLALGSITENMQLANILAYLMASSIFLGISTILVFAVLKVYSFIKQKAGDIIALSCTAIIFPLSVWLCFYVVIFLKMLAQEEFLWLIGQINR